MVEGTAGNTGIGLAHICKALGYKCVIYMPDTQSQVCVYAVSELYVPWVTSRLVKYICQWNSVRRY